MRQSVFCSWPQHTAVYTHKKVKHLLLPVYAGLIFTLLWSNGSTVFFMVIVHIKWKNTLALFWCWWHLHTWHDICTHIVCIWLYLTKKPTTKELHLKPKWLSVINETLNPIHAKHIWLTQYSSNICYCYLLTQRSSNVLLNFVQFYDKRKEIVNTFYSAMTSRAQH